jgi:hypothetical protein
LLASLGSQPVLIPPGQELYPFAVEQRADDLLGPLAEGSELVALMAHMHERGRRWTFELASGTDDYECAGHIPRWDFHWQKTYDYARPPVLSADTRWRVTCRYDTRSDTQPVLPGWGTRNEMCLAVMAVALPAGVRF